MQNRGKDHVGPLQGERRDGGSRWPQGGLSTVGHLYNLHLSEHRPISSLVLHLLLVPFYSVGH